MPHCWKSHVVAHIYNFGDILYEEHQRKFKRVSRQKRDVPPSSKPVNDGYLSSFSKETVQTGKSWQKFSYSYPKVTQKLGQGHENLINSLSCYGKFGLNLQNVLEISHIRGSVLCS